MKKIILILFCLTLNAMNVWAVDFHLRQTQISDAYAPGVPLESSTVYVLVGPGNPPQVFKTVDSKPMEDCIKDIIPSKGGVLYYDGSGPGPMANPTRAQLNALSAYCRGRNISFIESPTN
jgi:hypothetical protein